MTFCSFGQDQWKLGGNTDFGPPPAQGLVSNSNYLGSLQNTPIVFGTNNTPRMFINNGLGGNNDGRIAFGNNLPAGFVPLDRLHLHHSNAGGTAIGMRFTSAASGTGALDGYTTGYASTGTPHVYFTSFELNTPFC